MALSEADRIAMLEALAKDETLKATQRLRALEELGRIEGRRNGVADEAPADDELAPDPMADLDEMEQQRLKRSRRAA
jgi:hypothetical protein